MQLHFTNIDACSFGIDKLSNILGIRLTDVILEWIKCNLQLKPIITAIFL